VYEYTVEGDIFKVNSYFVISKVIDLNYYILLVLVNSLIVISLLVPHCLLRLQELSLPAGGGNDAPHLLFNDILNINICY
jgi:hypothetical protein